MAPSGWLFVILLLQLFQKNGDDDDNDNIKYITKGKTGSNEKRTKTKKKNKETTTEIMVMPTRMEVKLNKFNTKQSTYYQPQA